MSQLLRNVEFLNAQIVGRRMFCEDLMVEIAKNVGLPAGEGTTKVEIVKAIKTAVKMRAKVVASRETFDIAMIFYLWAADEAIYGPDIEGRLRRWGNWITGRDFPGKDVPEKDIPENVFPERSTIAMTGRIIALGVILRLLKQSAGESELAEQTYRNRCVQLADWKLLTKSRQETRCLEWQRTKKACIDDCVQNARIMAEKQKQKEEQKGKDMEENKGDKSNVENTLCTADVLYAPSEALVRLFDKHLAAGSARVIQRWCARSDNQRKS